MTLKYAMIMVLAVLLVVTGCSSPLRALTPEIIRNDLDGVRARTFVPSLGVAEITGDDIITYGPVGKVRVDGDMSVSASSLYQLGSCTKAMTDTVLAKLLRERSLSWETRLLEIFPDLAATANPDYRDVTIGDIVTHRAGFPPGTDVATRNRLRNYKGTLIQYLNELLGKPSKVHRGRFLYSNNGYAALGAVIEKLSGLPYAEAMNKQLFEPLGINAHSGFPIDLRGDQPWGHTANWGAAAPARALDQFIPNVIWPAGMASMTLHDFARFVQLHLRGMTGGEDAGFSAEMINALHQPEKLTGVPGESNYAAGWVIQKISGETIHWHNGSGGNFFAYMAINPARKKGVVVVTNVGDALGDRVCRRIMVKLLTGRQKTS